MSQDPPPEPEREEQRLWHSVNEDTLGVPDPSRRIESRNYRTLWLDRSKLADLLARAPREGSEEARKAGVLIDLPWPDGSFKQFRIEEASIMEPGLAVRCPDFKTYRGRGSNDSSAYVRFSWSPSGFHAGASSAEGTVSIVPYSRVDRRNYIVYYGRDWRPGPEQTESDTAAGRATPGPPPTKSASSPQPSAASIEEITIERRCFRCENQYKLTLRRDGTATLMIPGFVDHACRGTFTRADFAALVALMQRAGFLGLNEIYADPAARDGAWVTTSVLVERWRKSVVNSNEAGPPKLKAIEGAINALAEKVAWKGVSP